MNRRIQVVISLLLCMVLVTSSLLVGCKSSGVSESSLQENTDSSAQSGKDEINAAPETDSIEFEKNEFYYLTTSTVFWFVEADRALDDALDSKNISTAQLYSSQISAMLAKYFLVVSDFSLTKEESSAFFILAVLQDKYASIYDCLEIGSLDSGSLPLLIKERDAVRKQINANNYIVTTMKDWTKNLGTQAKSIDIKDNQFKELSLPTVTWIMDWTTGFNDSIRAGDVSESFEISLHIADTLNTYVGFALQEDLNASELSAVMLIAAMGNCFQNLSILFSADMVNSEEVNKYLSLFNQIKSAFVSNSYIYTLMTQ